MKSKSVVDSETFQAIPQEEAEQVRDFMKYVKEGIMMRDITETNDYEPQENHGYCVRCHGNDFAPDELTTMYNGDTVCNGCLFNYCKETCQNEPDMVQSFIAENEKDFLEYWWSGLDDSDRLEVIREGYKKSNQDTLMKKLNHETEVEFCVEHDDFANFLKGE